MSATPKLNLLLLNARSLFGKLKLLESMCSELLPSCVMVTETWFSPSIMDAAMSMPGYSLAHSDHASRGGGVAVYVHQSIPMDLVSSFAQDGSEFLGVRLGWQSSTCSIWAVYHPAYSPVDLLLSFLSTCVDPSAVNFICGNFNCNFLVPTQLQSILLDFFSALGLTPVVSVATRVATYSASLLNQIFVSSPVVVLQLEVFSDFRLDHALIHLVSSITCQPQCV